jgi:hypothetical protein
VSIIVVQATQIQLYDSVGLLITSKKSDFLFCYRVSTELVSASRSIVLKTVSGSDQLMLLLACLHGNR